MTTLSKAVQASMLADAVARAQAYAAPYEALIESIATSLESTKVHAGKAKEERNNTWAAFKQALSIGAAAGHTVSALRAGLEVACDNAGIPGGSFRSYVNTVSQLFGDVMEGALPLADAEKLSIADARKRYRKISPEAEALQKLNEAVKGWTVEELNQLVAVALGEDTDDGTIGEVVKAATTHAEERAQVQLAQAA